MRCDAKTLLVAASVALSMSGARADVAPARATVVVFFTQDGQPYRRPVDFRIRCYGRNVHPHHIDELAEKGREPPFEEVYHYAGNCPDYGCTVDRPDLRMPKYMEIDYCDLTGKTQGRSFKVEKFGAKPVGECTRADDFLASWKMDCKLDLALPK